MLWIPSHLDEQPHLLVSPDVVFRTSGNACADALAGVAAQEALGRGLIGTVPHTDEWDAISAQVRVRARKALIDTLAVDAWEAKRPPKTRAAPLPRLTRALAASQHSWTPVQGGSWLCSACRLLVPGSRAEEAAESSCTPLPAPRVGGGVGVPSGIVKCNSYSILGNQVVHASHELYVWPEHNLYFCTECGSTAALRVVGLAKLCGCPSRRGRENLIHIWDGTVPSNVGLPKGGQAHYPGYPVRRGVGVSRGSTEGPPESP